MGEGGRQQHLLLRRRESLFQQLRRSGALQPGGNFHAEILDPTQNLSPRYEKVGDAAVYFSLDYGKSS